jgi:hypothetical protein
MVAETGTTGLVERVQALRDGGLAAAARGSAGTTTSVLVGIQVAYAASSTQAAPPN